MNLKSILSLSAFYASALICDNNNGKFIILAIKDENSSSLFLVLRRKFGEKCSKVSGASMPEVEQLLIDKIQQELEDRVLFQAKFYHRQKRQVFQLHIFETQENRDLRLKFCLFYMLDLLPVQYQYKFRNTIHLKVIYKPRVSRLAHLYHKLMATLEPHEFHHKGEKTPGSKEKVGKQVFQCPTTKYLQQKLEFYNKMKAVERDEPRSVLSYQI